MCTNSLSLAPARGFTLVEVVITILVISIVAVVLTSAQAIVNQRSSDPMISCQAIAVAESYLEEILAKDYLDPNAGTVCPAAPGSRALYDNVCDYDGLSGAIEDQLGNSLGLTDYTAAVSVAPSGNLNGVNSANVVLVTVTVTDPLGHTTKLSGYRANY